MLVVRLAICLELFGRLLLLGEKIAVAIARGFGVIDRGEQFRLGLDLRDHLFIVLAGGADLRRDRVLVDLLRRQSLLNRKGRGFASETLRLPHFSRSAL